MGLARRYDFSFVCSSPEKRRSSHGGEISWQVQRSSASPRGMSFSGGLLGIGSDSCNPLSSPNSDLLTVALDSGGESYDAFPVLSCPFYESTTKGLKTMRIRMIVIAVGILSGVSCQSTGVTRASQTVDDLRTIKSDLTTGKSLIDASSSKLTTLAAAGGDMKTQYQAFVSSVNDLTQHAKKFESHRAKLESQRKAFLTEWDQKLNAITDELLRKKAEERKSQITDQFEQLSENGDETKKLFDSYLENLKNVARYLENDLNAGGLETITVEIENAQVQSTKLNGEIDEIVAELDSLVETMAAAEQETGTTSS